MKLRFLALDEVLGLHAEQIELYGGRAGVRDLGLLESAVAAPQASYGGAYLHATLAEMAAAYLFHLAQNHPFVDGNKRVAAASTIMFIYLNERDFECTEDELVDLTLAVARGEATKAAAAVFLTARIR